MARPTVDLDHPFHDKAITNDTEFGPASCFFAGDLARVFRVAEALDSRMVGLNSGPIATAEAPSGRAKLTGSAAKALATHRGIH